MELTVLIVRGKMGREYCAAGVKGGITELLENWTEYFEL
jgi:hypothetical protein